jgi:peptidoglycan/xylan/chitin deacetylase (PgdA/CDA1 family)
VIRALAAATALLLASCASQPEIAITVDDLPVHAPYPPGVTPLEVNRQMIAALKTAGVPATAFVNAVNARDGATTQALGEWHAAGFALGNHTWSHPHLSELSVAQFEDEVTKDEPILERLGEGTDWRWFRYPFLDEGRDEAQRIAARQFLARRGYRVAAVTMSFSDWAFTPTYARCVAAGNGAAVEHLEQLYLQSARENLTASRDAARKVYGRDVPYVLLMHVSALSAKMMPQLLRLYRAAGARFVSLSEAESDPVYAGYTHLDLPPPKSPQQLAIEKGISLREAPDHSSTLASLCA